jgi:hypothetical protein
MVQGVNQRRGAMKSMPCRDHDCPPGRMLWCRRLKWGASAPRECTHCLNPETVTLLEESKARVGRELLELGRGGKLKAVTPRYAAGWTRRLEPGAP